MTASDDPKTVLQRYVDALDAGDARSVRELFAPDASWRLDAGDLPTSGTFSGREAIIDGFLKTAMSHYAPDTIQLQITSMIAEGDRVVLQWTSRAKTVNGRDYENDNIGVFTVRDGKIQNVREYMDTLYVKDVVFAGAGRTAAGSGG